MREMYTQSSLPYEFSFENHIWVMANIDVWGTIEAYLN